MAFTYREGNLIVHTHDLSEFPLARVYDERDERRNTLVVIDILTSLPLDYEEDEPNPDQQVPAWEWVCEAMKSCSQNQTQLYDAWLRYKSPP